MARNGQTPLFSVVEMQRPLVGYAADFPNGYRMRRHRHPAAQLIYASSGVMTVTTPQGRWVVPPHRAVWVPPAVSHSVRMTGEVKVRTLYLDPSILRDPPPTCCVVHVSALLRELIVRVTEFVEPYAPDSPEARITRVVVDEIEAAHLLHIPALHLRTPRDPRLLVVTTQLVKEPADQRTLAQWSRTAGASPRTLARLFQKETGMSFTRWRQQACLLRALELLAAGGSVTAVAIDLGYDSVSAFINMFRENLGATPGHYFSAKPVSGSRSERA